jgi:hypothetical protein
MESWLMLGPPLQFRSVRIGHPQNTHAIGLRPCPAFPRKHKERHSSDHWVTDMGNSPCQVLAIHCPPGGSSSPQANSASSSPPRATSSHSTSVGICLPAQLAYAAASGHATWTTGWSGLLRIELPDP